MHRFFVSPGQIEGNRVSLTPEQAHQVARVLRLRPGGTVCVLDGSGVEYTAVLEEVSPARALARITQPRAARREPGPYVCLGLAILKGERMDWAVQKATEVGVSEIAPVACAHSIARVDAGQVEAKARRWQKIALEAAEQCRRARVPVVAPPVSLPALLERAPEFDRVLLADEQETARLAEALAPGARRVLLLVGPEGGFAPEEVAAARAEGALAVSLGPLVLRAETAAIVGIALVMHELEDRSG